MQPFERRRPARRPLPEHLPRERIVHPAPAHCSCCGGDRLRKIGEDVTETLELVPRQWKVIEHVREKFSCRACEAISQPPAPFHPISRGRAGPRLLAHILFAKYGLHLPLNRQSTTYAHEGVMLDVSTLADWVGAAAATLMPLVEAIKAHVLIAERIHADDTTVPVLAKGKTRTGRVWTYVRDDRPSPGTRRRPPCSSTRPTAPAPIPRRILRPMPDRCRRTPMPASTGSTIHRGSRARSLRSVAGRTHGASSSRSHG
ncbi:hypothetical protein; putative transposase (fragment) [Bradyrhizobium sp. ORS 285]